MKYDVVALLSDALNSHGLMDEGVSNHSTISLNMKGDLPTINIKNEDEVWIWSRISEFNPSILSYSAANVLNVILNSNEDFFYAGQPYLYQVEGFLELRAQVKEEYLTSSEAFISLLDQYLAVLQEYRQALI